MRFALSLLFILFLFLSGPNLLICQSEGKTVVDPIGRKLTVPLNPRRVVSLAPSITEIIFAIGQGDRLKGVTIFSDYPEKAKHLPKVGSYVNLDLERIIALQPDLCIAVKDGNPKDVIKRLESLKIPVFAVDPKDLDSVLKTILHMGHLLNSDESAKKIVAGLTTRIDAVTSLVKKAKKRPGVFFQIGISPIVSVGSGTFIHELISLAGGENLAKGPVPYPRFSIEQVLAVFPDIFIITSMARGEIFERVKAQWEKWPSIPAVKNQRLFLVNSDLFDRASPRLVDGLELLLKLIHPELVGAGL